MLQITADVAIPNELLQAARAGRLVLFIGAGVSLNPPSSLPLFDGLAKRVAEALGEPYARTENPDSQLGDLHARHQSVKELVRAIIADKASLPNDTHRSIARLASASGARVVSTNYDEHVESAAREEGISLGRRYLAPALPLGRDFEGIIYLHGSVTEDAATLVLTDEDFGRAYLTDGWARRFAHELFMNWTVLFVGYSHNDVVMTYLARGLPSGAKRFVLTDEPNHKRWRPLGITPVSYPPANSHKALTVALDAWAELMRMGQLDHYARVREIVSGSPPKAPEEIDYLADAITTTAGLNGFVSLARGHDWLVWAESQAGFQQLFAPGRRTDEYSSIWGDWFVDHFVSGPDNTHLGMGTIARRGPVLSEDLIWRISRAQGRLHSTVPDDARRWAAVLAAGVRTDGGEVDSTWYQPYSNPYTGEQLLPTLRRALVPRITLGEKRGWMLFESDDDDGEIQTPAGISAAVGWSISEGLLKMLWERLATEVDRIATDVLQIAEQGLRDAYALQQAFEPDRSFDSWSFRRSAVEPHAQDQFGHDEDVIVDMLRDCGVLAARNDPSLSQRWLGSDLPLFKRLGVHLLAEESTSADSRLVRILDAGLLYDYDAKHEVFRFLAKEAESFTTGARARLLGAIAAGPPRGVIDNDDGHQERFDTRARFDRLEWLQRYVEGWTELDEAVASLSRENPDMRVRPHPDHDTWMESGTWGGKLPVNVEEFTSLIRERGAWRAVATITARDYSEREFNEPTWDDAVRLVRETAAGDPEAGLLLYPALKIIPLYQHRDLLAACIYGWAESQSNDSQLNAILTVLELNVSQADLARAVSQFVLGTARRPSKDLNPEVLERLDRIAADVWTQHSADFEGSGWSDSLMRGLNTWPGFLAQYWIQRVSLRWQSDRDNWSGINATERSAIDAMVQQVDKSDAGNAALGVLAADFSFLFAADGQYASERLLPLFDTGVFPQSVDAWFAFLHTPRTFPEMLDAGFWELLLQAEETVDALSDSSIKEQYWRLIAFITAFSTAASVDRPALLRGLTLRRESDVLVRYLRALGAVLGAQEPEVVREVWDKWLGSSMRERCSSAPGLLDAHERSTWGDLALELALRDALEISSAIPGPITRRTRFGRTSESSSAADAALLVGIAEARLKATEVADWHVRNELGELVNAVRTKVERDALRSLVETALEKGIGEALSWMPPD